MKYVSGWLLTEDGLERGSIGYEKGIIQEVVDEEVEHPFARGIIMPTLVNAHTHIGDSFIMGEIRGTLDEIVRPPDGLKHRMQRSTERAEIVAAMRQTAKSMFEGGTVSFCDFREGGLDGISMLYESCLGLPVEPIAFGRPSELSLDKSELASLLRVVDGIGVSSMSDWDYSLLESISQMARSRDVPFALHASEGVREDIDKVLDLRPSFLVHMTQATDSDLEVCAESGVPIVVCPRSNAFFGKLPNIPRLLSKNVTLMLGTDNAMISNPSLWDEMRFAYYTAKSLGEIDILDVFRMVLNSRKGLKGEGALGSTVGSKPDFIVLAPRGHDPTLKALLSASERDVSLVCTGDRVWRRQGTRLIEEGGS